MQTENRKHIAQPEPKPVLADVAVKGKTVVKTDLSSFDTLECPNCDTLTKPKKLNKNNSVTYKCKECEERFVINENGDLVEN